MEEGGNPEDGRWRRWIKLRVGKFVISEIHGPRKSIVERAEDRFMGRKSPPGNRQEKGELRLLFKENDGRWAFCIKEDEVDSVLEWLHDVHGHFATPTTIKKAMGRVYWPTRSKDIAEFCRSCKNCQMMGPLRRNSRLPHPILQVQPMDMFGNGFLGSDQSSLSRWILIYSHRGGLLFPICVDESSG